MGDQAGYRVGARLPGERLVAAVGLFRARRLDEARAVCDALLDEPGGSEDDVAWAAYWAARCARRQERPADALHYLYRGAAAAEAGQDGVVDCRLRAEAVHTWSSLGENEDALVLADSLRDRAQQVGAPVAKAAAREALASIHWMTADWVRGSAAYRSALSLAQECGDLELVVLSTMGLAAAEDGLADLAAEEGDRDEARRHARAAIELQYEGARLAGTLGDDYLVMYAELNAACSLHTVGDLTASADALLRIIEDPTRSPVHGNALATLGKVLLDGGDAAAALTSLETALGVMERDGKLFPQILACGYLVEVHEALGQFEQALARMRHYHALFVRNSNDRAHIKAAALTVRYETERALAVAQAQRERADRLERSNAELAQEAALHARSASLDGLTGVANRRGFDLALDRAAGQDRGGAACTVALIDVDHFKQVNDTLGHLVGDEVLRRVSALVRRCCDPSDVVARYGGDEFVVLGAAASTAELIAVAERIRRAVAHHEWATVAPGLAVTVSVGVALLDEVLGVDGAGAGPDTGDALMRLADDRLYAAKREGRDRVAAPTDPGARHPAPNDERTVLP